MLFTQQIVQMCIRDSPTNMRSGDSVPKISTGKYFREGEKLMLPISVTCHHGLMDGYHVAKFIETLDL